jgi:hypothetical protein
MAIPSLKKKNSLFYLPCRTYFTDDTVLFAILQTVVMTNQQTLAYKNPIQLTPWWQKPKIQQS